MLKALTLFTIIVPFGADCTYYYYLFFFTVIFCVSSVCLSWGWLQFVTAQLIRDCESRAACDTVAFSLPIS